MVTLSPLGIRAAAIAYSAYCHQMSHFLQQLRQVQDKQAPAYFMLRPAYFDPAPSKISGFKQAYANHLLNVISNSYCCMQRAFEE
jgi:hypothetical protein